MTTTSIVRSAGVTRWAGPGLLFIWLASSLPFVFLYTTSHRAIVDEIRQHAMGVAIATAACMDANLLNQIQGVPDVSKPSYKAIQGMLDRITESNPDIRYVYTMRRSPRPLSSPGAFEYIVDQSSRDENGNGLIERDEQGEMPGTPYDASKLPEMIASWDHPTADLNVTPDPPYPDLISGYAPVRDTGGETRAIVGVDITAATIHRKMAAVQIVIVVVWLIVSMLVTLVIHLYYQQRDAYERIKNLNEELGSRNELLRITNLDLWRNTMAAPRGLTRQVTLLRDTPGLACAVFGGDLFDIFDLDHDRAVVLMAHVAGSGISAALIAGLLKMAMASVRDRSDVRGTLYVDLSRPDHVLRTLNEMLVKEMPAGEFVSFIYAVIDLATNTVSLANAGHGSPIRFSVGPGGHEVWNVPCGKPLGVSKDEAYPLSTKQVHEGDHLVFYSLDLVETRDGKGTRFGEDKLVNVMAQHAGKPPYQCLVEVCTALEAHTGNPAAQERFSIMDVQVR